MEHDKEAKTNVGKSLPGTTVALLDKNENAVVERGNDWTDSRDCGWRNSRKHLASRPESGELQPESASEWALAGCRHPHEARFSLDFSKSRVRMHSRMNLNLFG